MSDEETETLEPLGKVVMRPGKLRSKTRPQRSAYPWATIAATLREQPGQWFLAIEGASASTALMIKKGRVVELHPDEGFEVRTRNNVRDPAKTPTRSCDLWLRLGPEKDPMRRVLRKTRGTTKSGK